MFRSIVLDEGSSAAASTRENVCQRTMLFEVLSPLETCLSNRERETSTNYTFDQLNPIDGSFDWSLAPFQAQPGSDSKVQPLVVVDN